MQIQIESTDQLTSFDGVPVRLWKGVTSDGTECFVFVHRIAVSDLQDNDQFERELIEQLPPVPRHVPLNQIL